MTEKQKTEALMKINQAAELAGITSKNIRFYEDQGLIAPARDSSNGYRDYSMEDVEQLCRIKLLRMLGISCENIRRLQLMKHLTTTILLRISN